MEIERSTEEDIGSSVKNTEYVWCIRNYIKMNFHWLVLIILKAEYYIKDYEYVYNVDKNVKCTS